MNKIPALWYHGSPHCCFETAEDYSRPVMFMSDSQFVAKEYLRELVGSGTHDSEFAPTLYELLLKIPADAIFDMRIDNHREAFPKLAKISRERFGEDGFSKSDVMAVPRAHGSKLVGTFPSFGIAISLLGLLRELGFAAAFFAEGSQGASLAVLEPQKNVTVVSHRKVLL